MIYDPALYQLVLRLLYTFPLEKGRRDLGSGTVMPSQPTNQIQAGLQGLGAGLPRGGGRPHRRARGQTGRPAACGTARASLRLCWRMFHLPDDYRTVIHQQLNILSTRLCKGDKGAAALTLWYEPERIHTLIQGFPGQAFYIVSKRGAIHRMECAVKHDYEREDDFYGNHSILPLPP